jgi:hypothetical protein
MAGSIWILLQSTEDGTKYSPGSQASYDAAKAAVEAAGGLFQVGPNDVALALGTFLGTKTSLVRITNTGKLFISGFRLADIIDPTKSAFFDLAAVAAATERIVTMPNWSGLLPLPPDAGVSGQFLRSNAPAQPSWASIVLTNALLDGANHSDTVAKAVLRGMLPVGNATPKWDGLPIGAASTLLKSDGSDPSWGTINLLSAFIADALAAAVQAGDVIIGNGTPKWSRLGIGSAGQVLGVSGGLPAWISNPALQHEALNHIAPISVASCSINNASNRLDTATVNGFANVRVGDRVYFIASTGSSLWSAKISGLVDSDSVDLDLTNTSGGTINSTCLFIPGDHWNDTATVPDSAGTGLGYFLTLGRGTHDAAAAPGGTFQEIRGPVRWEGYESGHRPDFRVMGSTSSVTPSGFCILNGPGGNRAYFHTNDLTGNVLLRLGNPASGDFFVYTDLAQILSAKTLTLASKIVMDGTATYTCFRSAANVDRLGFDLSGMSALRSVKWTDRAGTAVVEGAVVAFANADTTPSVLGGRLFLTANAGATSITMFDDGYVGQEITVIFGDANTTLVDGGNLKLNGNFTTPAADSTWKGVFNGTNWHELSRSVN